MHSYYEYQTNNSISFRRFKTWDAMLLKTWENMIHWLKVPECIQFKALVTVYQCVNDLAPSFVKDLLNLDLNRKSFKFGNTRKASNTMVQDVTS